MSPGSSGKIRRSLKRYYHGIKKVFRPQVQESAPRTLSPQPQSEPEPEPEVQPEPQLQLQLRPQPQPPAETPLLQLTASPEQTTPQLPVLLPQPVPSASQSVPVASFVEADENQPVNAGPRMAQAPTRVGAGTWAGVKAALRLLEKRSNAFSPMTSVMAPLLGVIDILEKDTRDRHGYGELALTIQQIVDTVIGHPGEYTPSRIARVLQDMAADLAREVEHIERLRHLSKPARLLGATQEADEIKESHDRVERLRRAFQDKAMVRMWKIEENQEADKLLEKLKPALKAMHDSNMTTILGRRACTPGTREAVLRWMRDWADDPTSPKVYWLNGMAGTGKTTLAYSFCDEMQRKRRLGASFFCSRADAESQDVSRIVPTIAHQLARLLPSYREALVQEIDWDKDICARRTETQFEKLIRDPLRKVEAFVLEGIVVTIEALDECDRRDEVQDILNVLFLHARDLPIKFLVTCRPEPGLFDTLQRKDERYRSVLHLHDVETSFVQADITRFLEAELGSLALPQEMIGQLAKQAGSLFIYAAAAVRYIYPKKRPVNSHKRFEDFLSTTSKASFNKYRIIDEIYTAVLAAPFADEDLDEREKENIQLVLCTAICAREPISVAGIAELLGLNNKEDVMHALGHLRSVLHVSQRTDVVSTLHDSFPDFMFNQQRSKHLFCDGMMHNERLALACFSIMQHSLRFNICDLDSSFIFDQNVSELGLRVDAMITPGLWYACRYWIDHLGLAEIRDSLSSELAAFLYNRLLFWMEVLNLKNWIYEGAHVLRQARSWLQKTGDSSGLLELADDSAKFVMAFSISLASRSTPHIYISALPFWPPMRPVSRQYRERTQGLLELEGPVLKQRNLPCLGIWNAASNVNCVAFSPGGTRIVSSSNDRAIRVWNVRTGTLVVGPFKGHTHRVNSVAFSPDGTLIVSGSSDNTIRIWDAYTGLLTAGPLKGHTGQVCSVAFSLDGTLIASGSSDNTIRVWDVQSGFLVVGPFEGHTHRVNSVAFSPDGTLIVSGSSDHTIRVWDARTGLLVTRSFEGHTGQVHSVKFSPDGALIVSGSSDSTVRIWDARTGLLTTEPFKGHTGQVLSVAFSPDGAQIASGSSDSTICVWDVRAGLLVGGPFRAHSGWVYSVAFSPDGALVASGSGDHNICVWDAHGEACVAESFGGHTGQVKSVAISPDGTLIVSGSEDCTIRVWDASTGLLTAGPFKGHTGQVCSVAFSPNGACIASGSSDSTIRVWDVHTGLLIVGPFEGHTHWVYSVAFSPDSASIASGSGDNTIRVWDAHTGLLVAGPFKGHSDWVYSVAFSLDGTHIASGSRDSTIRIWDARTGFLVVRPSKGNTSSANSVAFSPDGAYIVSGSEDCAVRVWDACTGLLVARPFKGHTGPIRSVAFSPDSASIVSGSSDNTIRVWDTQSGLLIAGPFEGHSGCVNSVGFSPNGTLIVSGSGDHNIRVWDVQIERFVAESFEGHTNQVDSTTFPLENTGVPSSSLNDTVHATPSTAHDSRDMEDWLMDKQGIVTTRQRQLLLCIPPDIWASVMRPQNPVCICNRGALSLSFNEAMMGDKWSECYQRQRTSL